MSGDKQNTKVSKNISSLVVMLRSNKRFWGLDLPVVTIVSSMMITLILMTQSSPLVTQQRNRN
jgi:ABC-type microcin C transport system permease subunit YejB